MRHGFKAKAERISIAARGDLHLAQSDPLDPWKYASHLGVFIIDFNALDIPAADRMQLVVHDSDSWSGMTIREGDVTAVVVNPSHSRTRQSSTLMHELAHLILKHIPARVEVSASGIMLLSDYSDEQEEEADWLAAALLLPRDALLRRRAGGAAASEIASSYGVSVALCEWRIRMTGVDSQLRRSRR